MSLVVLAILGFSPVGNALIIPLENRFPPWDATRGPPDGIIVLGGAINGAGRANEVVLNEGAERLTIVPELARRHPNARILFSGGSGALIGQTDTAVHEWVGLAVYWLTGRSSELFPVATREDR